MTKEELRIYHLNLRKQMSISDVNKWSRQIVCQLCNNEYVTSADRIFSYFAFRNEVNLADLEKKFDNLALPQVIDRSLMVFREINGTTSYVVSDYGVTEPVTGSVVTPNDHTVILLPGSCFDLLGNRIGYGGGYYDRYLKKNSKGIKIGICYEHQLTDKIPAENHDVILDGIITEDRYIRVDNKKT